MNDNKVRAGTPIPALANKDDIVTLILTNKHYIRQYMCQVFFYYNLFKVNQSKKLWRLYA
ncbi:hypothetical protein MCHI_000300 [Candidatus Magnetoovum chiemensis]|nr:hypothetical protein MCHI_000300 [Candidatus Magnetoovum chiemensis]